MADTGTVIALIKALGGGGGGGAPSYTDLTNKPQINSVELTGNKSLSDLGIRQVTDETVTGSTPAITGVADTRYICGTVSTISITPPQSGIIDVIFTSGSTPAVLTLPNTVQCPDWFDPTALEANTTYEINIMDGVWAVVATWA